MKWIGLSVLPALVLGSLLTACVSEDVDPDDGGANSGGTNSTGGSVSGTGGTNSGTGGTSGSVGGTSSGTGGTGTVVNSCVVKVDPTIVDFEDYEGGAVIGSDTVEGYGFGVADDGNGTFIGGGFYAYDNGGDQVVSMVDGQASTYAISAVSEELSMGAGIGFFVYGGCYDASSFQGLSLYVKGDAPVGTASVQLNPVGCEEGDGCDSPSATFDVTDTWTKIEIPWGDFSGGVDLDGPYAVDGSELGQMNFNVDFEYLEDPENPDMYIPTPATYELVIDDIGFY